MTHPLDSFLLNSVVLDSLFSFHWAQAAFVDFTIECLYSRQFCEVLQGPSCVTDRSCAGGGDVTVIPLMLEFPAYGGHIPYVCI